ncbi:hypothetical protein Dimus_028783 [Dionaea muscipula]
MVERSREDDAVSIEGVQDTLRVPLSSRTRGEDLISDPISSVGISVVEIQPMSSVAADVTFCSPSEELTLSAERLPLLSSSTESFPSAMADLRSDPLQDVSAGRRAFVEEGDDMAVEGGRLAARAPGDEVRESSGDLLVPPAPARVVAESTAGEFVDAGEALCPAPATVPVRLSSSHFPLLTDQAISGSGGSGSLAETSECSMVSCLLTSGGGPLGSAIADCQLPLPSVSDAAVPLLNIAEGSVIQVLAELEPQVVAESPQMCAAPCSLVCQSPFSLCDVVASGVVSEEVPPVIREAVRPQPDDGLGQPPRSTVESEVERAVGID